ncbi:MAG: hypothetical protein A2161_18825 [Candidatus Schekmanbacteria bacterium RBG_13_48_7]|uniref:Uncharacterized protein n=1 Tax=Candidatus Schekmanbacteria bacterium RBG_13_48_7 TaxID=1817878 RepID=A0A1F7RS87_9BACT|nr:MAG: hypothetical protein A2161_18825 [Candidatus Schekmanbacteria bacterium RBG_13_48_7]
MDPERLRLKETKTKNIPWKKWGPYLSERQWGTVREDYSANGDAWNFITHDSARSKAYRWGEEGIGGISDDKQILCFAVAFWNGRDSILKERLFGVSGIDGNHGEDVKEYYYYLDNTPTHSYMKMLYKYPQNEFPYSQLLNVNRKRKKNEPEYDLIDTGIFDADSYFDLFIEYAKAAPEDICIRIAVWDLAFHCIPFTLIDPDFAMEQLVLLTREWYMHPNGQLPAYEWSFSEVNPPVHAWAAWRVYKINQKMNHGISNYVFLERVFHKLLLNFTWWVNRKDVHERNIFQGGFLGLDNIGVFDRSKELPTGGYLEQTDGTSWMAMYCLNMMRIAIELSLENPNYQDLATKFFEHFLYIAGAMTNIGNEGVNLWNEEDEFFYDVLHPEQDHIIYLKVRSIVGLIPLFAVEILDPEILEQVPDFTRRLEWFLNYRRDLAGLVSRWFEPGLGEKKLLSLLRGHRMKCLLRRMLDEKEFLSDYGVRSLSKFHKDNPYIFHVSGKEFKVTYQPAESDSGMFGGNSNWRGPVWFPINFLIIESLQKFHHYYGDDFKIEFPHGSGKFITINDVAVELSNRLKSIFLMDDNGNRPVYGYNKKIQSDPHFKNYLLFHEYFHGDMGWGVGASHQTGWTGVMAKLILPTRK